MRTIEVFSLLCALVAGTIWLTIGVADEPKKTAPSAVWEYRLVPRYELLPDQNLAAPERLLEKLNKDFGAEGWELCAIDSPLYIFRRPK